MTPESALGRLINLREQLTAEETVDDGDRNVVVFTAEEYCALVDDLDNIIRSIKRGMMFQDKMDAASPLRLPDSEDTERRQRQHYRDEAKDTDPEA